MMSKRFSLAILVGMILFGLSSQVWAKDVNGKFGLGLDNMLNAASLGIGPASSTENSPNAPSLGLSFKYWIDNDWAINAVFGFAYLNSKAAEDSSLRDDGGFWAFSLDFKGIYNFSHGDMANMGLFAVLHMQKESTTNQRPDGSLHSSMGVSLGFGFTPEVFLTENFALCADFGLIFRVDHGFGVGLGADNLLGGLGLHYYF